jgi:hypothetical protein
MLLCAPRALAYIALTHSTWHVAYMACLQVLLHYPCNGHDISRHPGWSMQLCYHGRCPSNPFYRVLHPTLPFLALHSDEPILAVLSFPNLPAAYLVQPTLLISRPDWVDPPAPCLMSHH